ncbi:MAG: helix-turn-helix domain-containing protein [Bacteriovoracaceae bacterium]
MFINLKSKPMHLSKNLNEHLKKRGISLNELARQLDVPVSTVHGWLNGVEPKNIRDFKRVSDYLGISIEELCFGDGTNEDPNLYISWGKKTYKLHLSKIEKE